MRKFSPQGTILNASIASIIIRFGVDYLSRQSIVPHMVYQVAVLPVVIFLFVLPGIPGILVAELSLSPHRSQAMLAGAIAAIAYPNIPMEIAQKQVEMLYTVPPSHDIFTLSAYVVVCTVSWFFWLRIAGSVSAFGFTSYQRCKRWLVTRRAR